MWPTLPRPVDFPPVPLAPQCSDGVQIHNALAAIIKRIFRNYQTYLSKLSAFDATPTVRNWPGVVSWSSLGEAASLFNVRTLDTVSWRKSALLASAPGWIAKLFLLQSVVYSEVGSVGPRVLFWALKKVLKKAFESKFTLLSAQKSAQKSGFAQKNAQMSSFTQKRAQMSGSLKKSAQERGHSKEWNAQKSAQKSKNTQKSAFESKFTLLSAQKSDQKSGFAKKIFKSCSKLVSKSARNVGYGRPV